MKAFSFVGSSGSGKTRLIVRLISELKKRSKAVAVLKHCPHGFSLDAEGKDSRLFFEAGADSVALVSSDMTVVIQGDQEIRDFRALAREYFQDIDILLVEGGRAHKEFKKIEVLGKDGRPRPKTPAGTIAGAATSAVADFRKSRRLIFISLMAFAPHSDPVAS